MAGVCQDCTGCCETFEVRSISKPFGVRCKYLGPTLGGVQGCTIYNERPVECQHYICVWLDSQRRCDVERMPEELRPDVCKCVIGWPWGIDRETIHVYPYREYPDAWRRGAVKNYLRMVLSRGGKVVVYVNKDCVYAIRGDVAVRGTEAEFAELLFNLPEERNADVV